MVALKSRTRLNPMWCLSRRQWKDEKNGRVKWVGEEEWFCLPEQGLNQEVNRRRAWKDFSKSVAEHGSTYPRLISCSYVRSKDAVENESHWRNFAFLN